MNQTQKVLDMPPKGKGRPKGSGKGGLAERFVVKISEEYKTWMGAFAEAENATDADIFREAMRELARSKGFRPPPIR
jgi:hypothetical protein